MKNMSLRNNIKNNPEEKEKYGIITDYGIELYQNIKLKNGRLTDKEILREIIIRLKEFCNDSGYLYGKYQEYAIKNKIHFGILAQNRLKNKIIGLSSIIQKTVFTLLNDAYSENNLIKLFNINIEIEKEKKRDAIRKIEIEKIRKEYKLQTKIPGNKLNIVK